MSRNINLGFRIICSRYASRIYTVAGAYGFIYFESGLEEKEKLEKLDQERLLNDSEAFMVDYFAGMHYEVNQRLDNCTSLHKDTDQWTDYHQLSGRACPSTEFHTPFCVCVRMVRYFNSSSDVYFITELNYVAESFMKKK